ncbi:MAG: hypothetical protein JW882_01455, partial [Deltaproteobacteria bacterium]|nr:hypothetical protein [Deltaproteobacteria bacterium]
MKKTFCFILFGFMLFAASVWGDEVDDGLQGKAGLQIRLSAKQMVQAGVPGDEAVKMTQRMMENRFREEQVIRAHRVIMAAIGEDLPEKPVMEKAYEGMVKNMPPDIVLQAMEMTRSRYAYAYHVAEEVTPHKNQARMIGNAIAECLSAGLAEHDVSRIMELLQARAYQKTTNQPETLASETFLAARTMARLGVSGKAAADVVCRALENQFSEREMNMLQYSFSNGSLKTDPEALAHQYAGAIGNGERGKGLESIEGDRTGGFGRTEDSEGGQNASEGAGGGSGGDSGGAGNDSG